MNQFDRNRNLGANLTKGDEIQMRLAINSLVGEREEAESVGGTKWWEQVELWN
jgi:hypothetical protein